MKTDSPTRPPWQQNVTWIMAAGCALFFCQLAVRNYALGFGLKTLTDPIHYLPRLFLGAFYDVIYCGGATLLFCFAVWACRRHSRIAKFLTAAFLLVAAASLIAAILGVRFQELTGMPFSYQWLYYSDFLTSPDAHEAIGANLSRTMILFGILAAIVFASLTFAIWGLIQLLLRTGIRPRNSALVAGGFFAIYLPSSALYVKGHDLPDGTYEHPILYFLHSCLTARASPAIFTMESDVGHDDFLPVADRASEPSHAPRSPEVRNVILFVMESVSSHYVEGFRGKYPVTPTLARYRDKAAVFENICVPTPMTVNSLWSLLTAVYPWIDHRLIVREFPKIKIPSLSGELASHGYRTAFFNSGDNRYQRANVFLAGRGLQLIQDSRTLGTGQSNFHGTSRSFSEEGCNDRLTVAALNDWIGQQQGQPFFGMLWTVMTHYPYYAGGEEIDYKTGDEHFNRYLNALRIGDEALGKVLAHLEARGLMDSTLVVVIGDHGEAFGQHANFSHDDIHDETVHVPLMLINPLLFHGEVHRQIGSSVDIAPTILDVLGYPLPGEWQGRSLFSADRPNRAYFFEPFSGYWFGCREGDYTCLYNAGNKKYEVYDMIADPFQKQNLAAQKPEIVSLATRRLASWIQFQNAYIQKLAGTVPANSGSDAQSAGSPAK